MAPKTWADPTKSANAIAAALGSDQNIFENDSSRHDGPRRNSNLKRKAGKSNPNSESEGSGSTAVDDDDEDSDDGDSSAEADDSGDDTEEMNFIAPSGRIKAAVSGSAKLRSDNNTPSKKNAKRLAHQAGRSQQISEDAETIDDEAAEDGEEEDEADYEGLDNISVADTADLEELEEKEMEKLIIAEEEARLRHEAFPDDPFGFAGFLPGFGMGGAILDAGDGLKDLSGGRFDTPSHSRTTSNATNKRVRFAENDLMSDDGAASETSVAGPDYDTFVSYDELDPDFRHAIEANIDEDMTGSEGSGSSFWDFEGDDSPIEPTIAPAILDPAPTISPFLSAGMFDFSIPKAHTISIDVDSPYDDEEDSDGDEEEEEDDDDDGGSSGYESEDSDETDDELDMVFTHGTSRSRPSTSVGASLSMPPPRTPVLPGVINKSKVAASNLQGPKIGRFFANANKALIFIDRHGKNTVAASYTGFQQQSSNTDSDASNTINNSPQTSFYSFAPDDSDNNELLSSALSGHGDIMMSGVFGLDPKRSYDLGGQIVGPPERFFPSLEENEVPATPSILSDSFDGFESEDNGGLGDISEFIDLAEMDEDDEEQDDESESMAGTPSMRGKSLIDVPETPTPANQRSTEHVTISVLRHFDRYPVGAFRQNQFRAAHSSNIFHEASKPKLRNGRSAQALMTPLRKRKTDNKARSRASSSAGIVKNSKR
ncbi:hypothetical protein K402DRAFT_63054 [Aulographum hederae CBS 113979]|uniref:Uncharacterized protein n=1 Tax=Aulographum hederae CBS 113979 TaxID=1176131 RepID=A0A6G1H1K8_9PEZI|nr:hypothetical protein K402DRAFT_63054 [Aulographum hederae CBS 113979]